MKRRVVVGWICFGVVFSFLGSDAYASTNGAVIATNIVENLFMNGDVALSAEGIHSVEFRGELCSVDSITFSADGGSGGGAEADLWAPIHSVDLGASVVKIIKDPARSFVYALDKTGGDVLFIDLNLRKVVERLHVGATPNGADIDESGRYLYVGHAGDGSGSAGSFRIEKIDLDLRQSTASFVVPSITQNNSPLRAENITCGAGDTVYYNAAYTVWNNGLARQMDGATGADLGALPIIKSPMVLSLDKGKLYGQHRYTGNLGEMGVWEISGSAFTKTDRYSYSPYPYGWDYNNYSISGDAQLLSLGKKLFNAHVLDDVKGDFDELVYGLNEDGSVAFGKTAVWDTTTFAELGEATKIADLSFSSSVMDYDGGERRLYAFNATDQTLRVIGDPDPLQVYSVDAVNMEGYEGGELNPSNVVFSLENSGDSNVSWSASVPAGLMIVPEQGVLAPGESTRVSVSAKASIPAGSYDYAVVFANLDSGRERERRIGLIVYPVPEAPTAPANPAPAHDTSRIPAVAVAQLFEWEHANGGDDAGPWDTASSYHVYMSTNEAELISVASDLTNTVFDPGLLELNTTYYWQIVASNVVGVTSGPVWQFTTWEHGPLDHFEWTLSGTNQYMTAPFNVSVRAADVNGVLVPSYSNTIKIVGMHFPVFEENFEDGGSEGWSSTPGTTQSFIITNNISAVGDKCLLLDGYDKNQGNYYYHDLLEEQPKEVEFYVRADNTSRKGGYVQLRDEQGGSVATFHLEYRNMRINGWYFYNYLSANHWYKINLKLDWIARRIEVYLNDSYRYKVNFSSSADAVSHISLHNYDKSRVWFDDIRVVPTGPIPLDSISTQTVNMVSGEWSGTVVVGELVEKAFLKAIDASGISGDSDFFMVDYLGEFSFVLPKGVNEDSGVLTDAGQLVVSTAPSTNLVVNLSVDEGGDISTPAQVVIPAGQTHVFFDLTVLDDALLDGSEVATLRASSYAYKDAEIAISVHDNETATLMLSLPQTTYEGAGSIAGALIVSSPPDGDVVVDLVSNNLEKIGSSSLVIPTGQTFVSFSLPVLDNTEIDGIQTATIEARVRNWVGSQASVFVFDDETNGIDLQLPASVVEGEGVLTNAGSVSLSGDTTTDVYVMLTSSDTSEVVVPAYVTISNGQSSASFDITVVDDAETDGMQTLSILAQAPGFVPGSDTIEVQDNDLYTLAIDGIATNQPVLEPIAVNITAVNVDGMPMTWFTGSVALAASGDSGAVTLSPTRTTNFIDGTWMGDVAFSNIANNVVLTVDDGAGHIGTSIVFNVTGSQIIITPDSLTNTLVVAGETLTRTMVISNTGNADLEFTVRGGGVDPVDPSLIAHFPFNGNAADESGSGYDGTVNGATLSTDRFGNADSAYHFDGNDYITCGDVLDRKDGNWTYSAWIRSDSYNQVGAVLNKGLTTYGTPSNSGYGLYVLGDTRPEDEIRLSIGDDSGTILSAGHPLLQLPVNEYVFVTGVYEKGPTTSVVHLFINGVQVSSENVVHGYSDTNIPLAIGALHRGIFGPTQYGFVGDIDDVRIYNRALSASEISELYNESDENAGDAGLVADYPFNGNADDESGNGHDGTVNGATLTTDRFGNAESAYAFDGDGDDIRIGSDPDFPSWDNYTVSVWFMNDGGGIYGHGQKIIDKTSMMHDFYLRVNADGSLLFNLYEGGVGGSIYVNSHDYRDSQWHHAVITKNGNLAEMWIDGVRAGSANNAPKVFSSSDLIIGYSDSTDSSQKQYWSGNLDDVRIYNRALSAEDISDLYSEVGDAGLVAHFPFNGNADDESGNGHDGIINGAFAYGAGILGASAKFNGSDTYVEIPHSEDLSLAGEFSISVWVKSSGTNPYSGLVSKILPDAPRDGYFLGANYATRGTDVFMHLYAGPTVAGGVHSTDRLLDGEWHHITVTYNKKDFRIYVDGRLDAERTYLDGLTPNLEPLLLGLDPYSSVPGNRHFNGEMDELRIYNRALSEAEISALYSGGDGDDGAGLAGQNLILNGDFEEGNTRFTSTYTYSNTPASGRYFVGEDSRSWNGYFPTTLKDHTSGSGLMLMADGNSLATAAWEQTVDVITGVDYEFSAWVAGLEPRALPVLEFKVDGRVVGTVSTENITWKPFFGSWTAMSSGTITLSIRSVGTEGTGNDFAIDDIVFSATETEGGDGLAANYPFNGNADDESGNGHDGTVNGATLTTDRFGNVDSAYDFDGVDDYIDVSNSLGTEATPFTVSAWMCSTNARYQMVVSKKPSGEWQSGQWQFVASTYTGFWYADRYGNSYVNKTDADVNLNDGGWHHLCGVMSTNGTELYIDGELAAENTAVNLMPHYNATIRMGDRAYSVGRQYFDGKIDDVRIYKRVLSAAEITSLYNAEEEIEESWLSVDTKFGTIPPGSNAVISVRFNAAGLVAGDYAEDLLKVTSNDPFVSSNAVPASMWVLPPAPTMAVEPEFTAGTSNEVAWSGVAGPVEYLTEVGADTNAVPLQQSGWLAATNHTFGGLTTNVVYYYHVKASVSSGIGLLEGSWSDWVQSKQVISLDDLDSDLLPDGWEVKYFGSSTNGDPLADSDSDGQNNREEFITGMDPTDPDSLFMVRTFDSPTNGLFVVSWDSVTGRVYRVDWNGNLPDGFHSLETGIRHPQNSYTDSVHNAESQGFYRIGVELE